MSSSSSSSSSKQTPSSSEVSTGKSSSERTSDSQSSLSGGTMPPSHDELEEEEERGAMWGQLFPLDSKHYTQHKFVDNVTTFGRGEGCDYVFKLSENGSVGFSAEEDGLKLNQLSTRHFEVKRVDENNQRSVYITDLSSNGTFVNKDRLTRNKNCPLSNGDIISLVLPHYKAFHFVNTEIAEKAARELPYEFKRKYCLEQLVLGKGAMGTVHRGYVKGNYEKVAIKIIENCSRNLVMTPNLKYEAAILTKLNHTNIVKLLDVYETDDFSRVYIILEFVSGGELFSRIKDKGALSEGIGKIWFEQILNAVSYLHSQNILHRDLKPENILIEPSSDDNEEHFTLKVTDFNLSRFVAQESLVKTLVGTPMYLAPEIINPLAEGYSFEVDCWSLGCILFVMLGGYPPFNQETDLQQQIMKGKILFVARLWKNVSVNAINLIKNLIVVDVAKRFNVSKALQHPWFSGVKRPSEIENEQSKRVRTT